MRFPDHRTIKAIGELRATYPYAAALLSYVVVERVLKRYALGRRKDSSLAHARIPRNRKLKAHAGKELRELHGLTANRFLHEVLCEMTLGEVETLLGRPQADRSAPDRNEVMHSNLYLKKESRLSRAEQTIRNRTRFDRAFSHLRRALEQFDNSAIVDNKGALCTRSLTSA
jgi:hypothetical protein